ncbi:Crp/Fnr family transcriptional regulator [Azonexus sp. IMCC34839]|uniref:Crp/Fnr family transcriptional regulator n=1 Tax=Azonexus sp. IMCC34839 TaxID=3133695 RepID=UPI00399AD647
MQKLPIAPAPLSPAQGVVAYPAQHRLFESGADGTAWRVCNGVIRLDKISQDGGSDYAGLAIRSDILGCETLLLGQYCFRATSLTPCTLTPWPDDASSDPVRLIDSLNQAQRRAAQLIALRGGQAVERVIQLIKLLVDGEGRVILPTRQDIADITDLRFETVSRLIHGLVRDRVLSPIRIDGIHATRSFTLNPA